jgi:2-polyprenyl-6-hydroxyphenyl methylase/3-demethylubiquinone-9 3-methyltransferase
VGCGGGYLSEELAKIGLDVTGLDPSPRTIETARTHAAQEGLTIDYREGCGEELPFASHRFDFVCCCDVLEHVDDFSLVIKEIARVLKPGGVFFYDTINRTLLSKLIMINIMQDWKATAFLDPGIHSWSMFIKPQELLPVLTEHQLVNQDIKGLSPGMNFFSHYINLRKRARGEISWEELGKRLKLRTSRNTTGTYIGYAVKSGAEAAGP